MGITVQQKDGMSVEVVYSPDDGGYWLSQFDVNRERERASKKVYATHPEAVRELNTGRVKWERWR